MHKYIPTYEPVRNAADNTIVQLIKFETTAGTTVQLILILQRK